MRMSVLIVVARALSLYACARNRYVFARCAGKLKNRMNRGGVNDRRFPG